MILSRVFFLFFLILPLFVLSQGKHDHNWIIGTGGFANKVSFQNDTVKISPIANFHMAMEGSNTSMSDIDGKLLFYTNGCFIGDHLFENMENGNNLNPGLMQEEWCQTGGNPISQSTLSLPDPGNANAYYLFHIDINQWWSTPFGYISPFNLYYSKIEFDHGTNQSSVVSKNNSIYSDTLFNGFLTGVKHGNGKDWWILTSKYRSNCIIKTKVYENGVDSINTQCFDGEPWEDWDDVSGQATFSPNGEKYAIFQTCYGLNLYDFDRCTGELSNYIHISMDSEECHVGGVAFSPNSRFLYVTTHFKVFQFDLWAQNIEDSKLTIGEFDPNTPSGEIQFFYQMQLAPDEKIYIGPYSYDGIVNSLHVINSPNSLGMACNLVRRGFKLSVPIKSSLPNFPHYRLGPIEGGCDSTIVTSQAIPGKTPFKVYPNPSQGQFTVELSDRHEELKLIVFDLFGRKVASKIFNGDQVKFHLEHLEDGVYFIELFERDALIGQHKIVKQGQ